MRFLRRTDSTAPGTAPPCSFPACAGKTDGGDHGKPQRLAACSPRQRAQPGKHQPHDRLCPFPNRCSHPQITRANYISKDSNMVDLLRRRRFVRQLRHVTRRIHGAPLLSTVVCIWFPPSEAVCTVKILNPKEVGEFFAVGSRRALSDCGKSSKWPCRLKILKSPRRAKLS
jgi:hypothetical protein